MVHSSFLNQLSNSGKMLQMVGVMKSKNFGWLLVVIRTWTATMVRYMSFSSTHQLALFPELSSPWIFANLFQEIRSEMQEAVWVHFRAGLVGGWSLHEWEGYARWGVWRVIWRIHCMHACYLCTKSWNRHFTIYCTYNLQIAPTISRSRIAAIKSECKKNTGWIRLLRCNQLRQACKPTCLLQCVCFSESFLSTVASGEIGMKSTFKSFGWRINWLAGVWLLLALSPIFKTSKSSILSSMQDYRPNQRVLSF